LKHSADKYIPYDLSERFRDQAVRVWAVTFAVVVVWVLLIVVPPVLASSGNAETAGPLYSFFSYICHQIPSRTFHLLDHPMAACSRCFGVYLGLALGVAVYPLWRKVTDIEPLPRKWLLLSIVPMGIDWTLNAFDIWYNTFLSRFVTGLILGLACATYILPALVEIFRNFSSAPGPQAASGPNNR
jgi:uncharacterized membrane protein